MMKIYHFILLGICIFCLIFFSACGSKHVPDSSLGPSVSHDPATVIPSTDHQNPLDPTIVQGLEASILERADGIEIRWDQHPEADSYRIYRSDSRRGMGTKIAETSDIKYENTSAGKNQPLMEFPYFYRVTWINGDGIESGQDINPVMGVFSPQVEDGLEPNNKFENSTRLQAGQEYEAFICALIDAENEIATDEDWYVYERTDCTVKV